MKNYKKNGIGIKKKIIESLTWQALNHLTKPLWSRVIGGWSKAWLTFSLYIFTKPLAKNQNQTTPETPHLHFLTLSLFQGSSLEVVSFDLEFVFLCWVFDKYGWDWSVHRDFGWRCVQILCRWRVEEIIFREECWYHQPDYKKNAVQGSRWPSCFVLDSWKVLVHVFFGVF